MRVGMIVTIRAQVRLGLEGSPVAGGDLQRPGEPTGPPLSRLDNRLVMTATGRGGA
jgi:hypothetical protein